MLLNVNQVAERLTVTRATIWRYVARDPQFPKPYKLSPGCSRWKADEVDAWFESRPREA